MRLEWAEIVGRDKGIMRQRFEMEADVDIRAVLRPLEGDNDDALHIVPRIAMQMPKKFIGSYELVIVSFEINQSLAPLWRDT